MVGVQRGSPVGARAVKLVRASNRTVNAPTVRAVILRTMMLRAARGWVVLLKDMKGKTRIGGGHAAAALRG